MIATREHTAGGGDAGTTVRFQWLHPYVKESVTCLAFNNLIRVCLLGQCLAEQAEELAKCVRVQIAQFRELDRLTGGQARPCRLHLA